MTVLGYARFYESINGMLPSERPDDDVIQDDVALDKWYQAYVREQAIASGKRTKVAAPAADIPQFNAAP